MEERPDQIAEFIGFRPALELSSEATPYELLSIERTNSASLAVYSLDPWIDPHLSAAATSALTVRTLLNSKDFQKAFVSSPSRETDPATGRSYLRVDAPASWKEAKLLAFKLGGRLATAKDESHLEWIRQRFVENHTLGTPLWIGAISRNGKGDWTWENGSDKGRAGAGKFSEKKGGLLIPSASAIKDALVPQPIGDRHSFLVEWEKPDQPAKLSRAGE